jgi:HSP20 family molecular chaperone IbpA
VSQRRDPSGGPTALSAFEHACDELFEELLITRWQRRGRPSRSFEGEALVLDFGTRYEVRIPSTRAMAERSEVEVSEHRLCVRTPGLTGASESVFDFTYPIETESVQARLVEGALHIVLPRKRGRKIKVE